MKPKRNLLIACVCTIIAINLCYKGFAEIKPVIFIIGAIAAVIAAYKFIYIND